MLAPPLLWSQPLISLFSDLGMTLNINLVDAQLSEVSLLPTTNVETSIQEVSSTLQVALADGKTASLQFQPGTSEIHLNGDRLLILEVHDSIVNFSLVENQEISITGEVALECANLCEYSFEGVAFDLQGVDADSQTIPLQGRILSGIVEATGSTAIRTECDAADQALILSLFDIGVSSDQAGVQNIVATACAKRCVCAGSTTGRCRPNDCNPDDPKNCPGDSGHTCQERDPL